MSQTVEVHLHPVGARRGLLVAIVLSCTAASLYAEDRANAFRHWVWSVAYRVPLENRIPHVNRLSFVEAVDGGTYVVSDSAGQTSWLARWEPKIRRFKRIVDSAETNSEKRPGRPKLSGRLYLGLNHGVVWDASSDRKKLYAISISDNQLQVYDLTDPLPATSRQPLGPLVAGAALTDCRALCVAPDGTVWITVAATMPRQKSQLLHIVSWRPSDATTTDHGPVAVGHPQHNSPVGLEAGRGRSVGQLEGGVLALLSAAPAICASGDGTVFFATRQPLTLHAVRIPRVAGIVTEYRRNAHADVLLTRLVRTDTLDGKGTRPTLRLASVYTDQVPANDTSRELAAEFRFPLYPSVREALTQGGHKLAVDGVMLVAEHGKYPRSDTGQKVYPKRRLFSEVVEAFRDAEHVVPVFCDKHLADNWDDAKWIYDTARELDIPLMAGSSVPSARRRPAIDVRRGAKLQQIVAVSYGSLDSYGFHGLEMVQALAERRAGGETGVRRAQCLTGAAVWQAGKEGVYDVKLLEQALSRLTRGPLTKGKRVEQVARDPVLFVIHYRDGLRAALLTLNGAVSQWAAAWRYAGSGQTRSTLFELQYERPYMHFNVLLMGIERLMHCRQAAWPVERTLLTSGMLDALLRSKRDGQKPLETDWLDVRYQSRWNWRQPPPW